MSKIEIKKCSFIEFMFKLNKLLQNPVYYGTELKIIDRANALRKEMTEAEKLLWNRIRRKKLNGFRFRRQHAISQFIVDFYCHEKKLVIEVDGEYHEEPAQSEYDQQRTYELEKVGMRVLRFTNDEVVNQIEIVIEKIKKYLN